MMPPPYRVKMVELIHLLPRAEREAKLKEAKYNVFKLHYDAVYIDLLTDSGTSAMSDAQWAAMITAQQAYAGSPDFYAFEAVVQDLTGYKFVLPTHQGRAAENVFFNALSVDKRFVPNNTHFDTTEANVTHKGGTPLNFAVKEAQDMDSDHPFKGNMDLVALKDFLTENSEKVPVILLTVTNNTVGGQPVSMENAKAVSALAKEFKIPLLLDAARFAENCYLVQQRENGYKDKSVKEIARELFGLADGCLMSAKKEGLVNIGGLIALNDEELFTKVKNLGTVVEGYPTYGGLACRDLAAMAQGLQESITQSYQEHRHSQVCYLYERLVDSGIPVVKPCGGHAVYVDGRRFLPHVDPNDFPAQALTAQLYIESGVRAVELGLSAFGKTNGKGELELPKLDLMRMVIPRRSYTLAHYGYVADALEELYAHREDIQGLKRTYAPELLGHFNAEFAPV